MCIRDSRHTGDLDHRARADRGRSGARDLGGRNEGLATRSPTNGYRMSVGDSAVLSETPLSGPLLFARYAYPPNELGYCGPSDASALIDSATEAGGESELGHLAKQFDGAWPYLELLSLIHISFRAPRTSWISRWKRHD